MINAPGLGSGLDVRSIIDQLMALERRPVDQLEFQKTLVESQISGYGKLKGALSSFQSAMDKLRTTEKFQVFSTGSSDEAVVTASASSSAARGSYDVVVTQLAQAHKSYSEGQADGNTSIGQTGTLTVTVGTQGSFDVAIDASNNTLAGVRDAINDAADNPGVTATLITVDADDDPNTAGNVSRLVLTADEPGTDYELSYGYNGNAGLETALNLQTVTDHEARNAILSVDGFTVVSASNIVTNAIQGVTLNLKQDGGGAATLTIDRDIEATSSSVQAFVDAFNTLRDTIKTLRQSELEADNTLLAIERQIVNVLNTAPGGLSGQFSYLTEVGVSFNKEGRLVLDSTDLEDALNSDFAAVADLFADQGQGYAYRLEELVGNLLDIDGLLDVREDGLDASKRRYQDRIDAAERRLETVEARLTAQFSALDGLVAQLQSTGTYLTQQLGSLI